MQKLTREKSEIQFSIAKQCWRFLAEILSLKNGAKECFLGYHVDDAQFTLLWSMLLDMAAAARNDVNVDEELYAVRELMRLNLKRQGDAHAWLAPRPDQDKTRLSNREAIDWISWYFGVPLKCPRSASELQSSCVGPAWRCLHRTKQNAICREVFSLRDIDHPSRCPKNGKVADHTVIKEVGDTVLSSFSFRTNPRETWIAEWKNSKRAEARIDLHIYDFGNNKPAYGDYTIRSIDKHHLEVARAAVRQGRAAGYDWMGWHRLIEDAEREKKEDHPLRTKEGHHILEGEFFPLVFSTFGTMGKGVQDFLARIDQLRGGLAARSVREALSVALARQVAQRIRAAYGKADDWEALRDGHLLSKKAVSGAPGGAPTLDTPASSPATSGQDSPDPTAGISEAARVPCRRVEAPKESYWKWCETHFDMEALRSPDCPFRGLSLDLAKSPRNRCLAELDNELRRAGVIVHPKALIYATKGDLIDLVDSLSPGSPRTRLEELGQRGSLGSREPRLADGELGTEPSATRDSWPGWSVGPRDEFGLPRRTVKQWLGLACSSTRLCLFFAA